MSYVEFLSVDPPAAWLPLLEELAANNVQFRITKLRTPGRPVQLLIAVFHGPTITGFGLRLDWDDGDGPMAVREQLALRFLERAVREIKAVLQQ